jgi:hypothetical protein
METFRGEAGLNFTESEGPGELGIALVVESSGRGAPLSLANKEAARFGQVGSIEKVLDKGGGVVSEAPTAVSSSAWVSGTTSFHSSDMFLLPGEEENE